MSSFVKVVGEQLRMIRRAKKLTQEQVADKSRLSSTRISDIERGQTNISLETLEKIMLALEITPSELFNFERLHAMDGIEEKKEMLEIHKSILMERGLDEVKYVVRTTSDFLSTVDTNRSKKR